MVGSQQHHSSNNNQQEHKIAWLHICTKKKKTFNKNEEMNIIILQYIHK
jgi:hypothetical protein